MRKTINIVGVGKRQVGIGKKTGLPYDFINFAISYDHPYYSGLKAEEVGIDTEVIGDRVINPGDILEVEMFSVNFKTRIGCIYG